VYKRKQKQAIKSPVKKAIRECIERGILADYLKRRGSEVENMLIAEYSYEEDIQVKQQEAEQKRKTRRKKGRKTGRIDSVRENLSVSEEES